MDPRLNKAAGSSGAVGSSSGSSSGPALTATVALILFLVNEPEARSFKVRRVVATRSHEYESLLAGVRSQAVVAEAAKTAATASMCLSYACVQTVHTEQWGIQGNKG